MKGQRGGSVKVRAKIEKIDKNTLAIKEIPYGKTTHVLVVFLSLNGIYLS